MHPFTRVVVQVLISVAAVAAILPMVIVLAPAARDPGRGTALAGVLLAGVFVLVRVAWPRARRR